MDLFGNEASPVEYHTGKRKPTKPNGYADIPGTGPAGKTCRDCEHYCYAGGTAGTYRKCALRRTTWTRGPGSDILAKSPACRKFTDATPASDGR